MKSISNFFEENNPPVYATGLVRPKTTSLFFDRIWVPNLPKYSTFHEIPEEVKMPLPGDKSNLITNFFVNTTLIPEVMQRLIASNWHMDIMLYYAGLLRDLSDDKCAFLCSQGRNHALLNVVNQFRHLGIDVVPIFHSKTEFENCAKHSFTDRHNSFYHEVIIKGLPIILEDSLSWHQVLEIRKDKSSIKRMRRFRSWASTVISDEKPEVIRDVLFREIEEYEHALKKHGVLFAVDGIATVLSASSTISSALLGSKMELVGAGLAITAQIITFAAKEAVDYIDTTRSPIAYIYELSRKSK